MSKVTIGNPAGTPKGISFEAVSVKPTMASQEVNRIGSGLTGERVMRDGWIPGVLSDYSAGLMPSPLILQWTQFINAFGRNDGLQARVPGVLTLPYKPTYRSTLAGELQSLRSSLIEHYALGEMSGNRAGSFAGLTLTDNNTVTQATGKVGNAAQFTAANNEYLERSDPMEFEIGSLSEWYMAVWVYLDSKSADRVIMSKWNSTGDQREWELFYRQTNDRFSFFTTPDGTTGSGTPSVSVAVSPSTSTWYFVEVWLQGSTWGIAVNRTEATASAPPAIHVGTANFRIGATQNGNYFDGRIDEPLFLSKKPSTAQRDAIYNGGDGITYEDFLALSADDQDTSTYVGLGYRAHPYNTDAGARRFVFGLGTRLFVGDSTGEPYPALCNVASAGNTEVLPGIVDAIAGGPVNGTKALLLSLRDYGIVYTTDVTANPVVFTKLIDFASDGLVFAIEWMPTVGPGSWQFVGTIAGAPGVWNSKDAGAAPWTPVASVLASSADSLPSSEVMFTSPASPSGVVNDATNGDAAWNTPSNAAANDGTYTEIDLTGGQTSQWLRASFDLTASVPSGAQVVGLVPRVERRREDSGTSFDYAIQIRVAGTQVGVTRYPMVSVPGVATTQAAVFGAFDDPFFADLRGSDLSDVEVWYRVLCAGSDGSGDAEVQVDYMSLAAAYRTVPVDRVIKTSRSPFGVTPSDLAITPSVRWANPFEGIITDGSYATFSSGGADQTSDYLLYGPFFAPGELPSTGAFNDIQVDIYRGEDNAAANAEDLVIQLYLDGELIGFNNAVLATEWNGQLTTIFPRSYGPRWGIPPLTGAEMSRLRVAVRVLADANNAQIDGIEMHVAGTVPGHTLTFSGPNGGGGSSSWRDADGWQIDRNAVTPNDIAFVQAGEVWQLRFAWDTEGDRSVFTFSQPNEGMSVHHGAPYQGGYLIEGNNLDDVGLSLFHIDDGGQLRDFRFEAYHAGELRINWLASQAAWGIMETVKKDLSDLQIVYWNRQRYHPDTLRLTKAHNGSGVPLTLPAQPIAWSRQPVNRWQNRVYSVFPNSTNTACYHQPLPPDLAQNPLLVNTSWVKTQATITADPAVAENSPVYLYSVEMDVGPEELNKALTQFQYIGRLASAQAGTYGTVSLDVSVDAGVTWDDVATFSAAFPAPTGADDAGISYRSVMFRIGLTHEAGTAKTPNGLPIEFASVLQPSLLSDYTLLIDPTQFLDDRSGWWGFYDRLTDLLDDSVTQPVVIADLRDKAGHPTLGRPMTVTGFDWTSSGFMPPARGETAKAADYIDPITGRQVYLVMTLREVPGRVGAAA